MGQHGYHAPNVFRSLHDLAPFHNCFLSSLFSKTVSHVFEHPNFHDGCMVLRSSRNQLAETPNLLAQNHSSGDYTKYKPPCISFRSADTTCLVVLTSRTVERCFALRGWACRKRDGNGGGRLAPPPIYATSRRPVHLWESLWLRGHEYRYCRGAPQLCIWRPPRRQRAAQLAR